MSLVNTTGMHNTIFLVGPRGAGKTTVGRALAQTLGFTFIDTDHELQQRCGLDIAQVVEKEGWSGFRRRESETLHSVTQSGCVIATGGGMVLAEPNRLWMREQGTVFYLATPVALLAQRLTDDPEPELRPSLTGKEISDEIADVLAMREPLYQATAHYCVDGRLSPQELVTQMSAYLTHITE